MASDRKAEARRDGEHGLRQMLAIGRESRELSGNHHGPWPAF